MRATAFLVALALAAPASANGFSEQLAAMSPLARTTMFQNYMRTAGKTCEQATRIFFKGALPDSSDLWNVQCSGGLAWSITIEPKGTTKIYDCTTAAAQGRKCFEPLAARGKRP